MKKETEASSEEMLPEYDFSGGVRGKYAHRVAQGSNGVVLAPDVAKLFSTSEELDEALRALVNIAQQPVSPLRMEVLLAQVTEENLHGEQEIEPAVGSEGWL